jgi:phage I-like protein
MVEGSKSAWIHIAPFGKWEGHESGDFIIDNKIVDKVIANYDRQVSPSMVDYEHDSLDGRKTGPKLAAGWVQKLAKRDDGLWALVEFNPRAIGYIQSGEIKFVSPAIDFRSKDRKTNKSIGPELINIALTNMPFLDGLTPIKLTRFNMGDTIEETTTTTVKKPAQLQLSEEETVQAQDETVDANAAIDALAAVTGLEPAAVVAALVEKQEEVGAVLVGAAEQEGSEAEAEMTDEQNPDAIKASRTEAIMDKTIVALNRRLETLEKEKNEEKKAAVEALVKMKIEEGYIPDTDKDDAIYLFTNDPERAERVYATKRVPIGETQGDEKDIKDKPIQLTKQQEAVVDNLIAMSNGAGRKLTREAAIKKMVASESN